MRTKKRATILLQSNYVGSFDCDHTPHYLYMGSYNSVPPPPPFVAKLEIHDFTMVENIHDNKTLCFIIM